MNNNKIGPPQQQQKPLVALLDGRDCSVEMPLLKDIATVAFCDAQLTTEIHEKVLNEAVAALLYSIRLSREDLLKFRSLKLVVKIGNPDVHNLDMLAASQLGIAVCNTPAEGVEEAADHAISLILNMFRRTFWVARAVQMGKKANTAEQLRELMAGARRVRGSTLGIVGFGRIGCAVALRAKALGFRVCFYDPNTALGMDRAFGVDQVESLADLLAQCDCLSLHCPLGPETRHMLNSDTLKSLKFGTFLVNVSQAELLDPRALAGALKSGQVRTAALDIGQQIGHNIGHSDKNDGTMEYYDALSNMPNVICTPNCAWFSEESLKEMRVSAAKEVRRALTGQMPESLQNCVNKSELLALRLQQQQRRAMQQQMAGTQNGNSAAALFATAFGQQQNGADQSRLIGNFGIPIVDHQQQQNAMPPFGPGMVGIGSNLAEYSASSAFPIDAIGGVGTSSSAESMLNNANNANSAAALLAYQSLVMRHNPQLLMAAGLVAAPANSANSTTILPQTSMPTSMPQSVHHPVAIHHELATSNLATSNAVQQQHQQRPVNVARPFVPSSSAYSSPSPKQHSASKSPQSSSSIRHESRTSTKSVGTLEQQQNCGHQNVGKEVDGKVDAGIKVEEEEAMRNSMENQQNKSSSSSSPGTTSPSPHGRLFIADEHDEEEEEGEEGEIKEQIQLAGE